MDYALSFIYSRTPPAFIVFAASRRLNKNRFRALMCSLLLLPTVGAQETPKKAALETTLKQTQATLEDDAAPVISKPQEPTGDEPATLKVTTDQPMEPLTSALVLLNSKVEPGDSKILQWELESNFSDVSAPASVLVVNGKKTGPTVCLTAAVHGDELNGIEIVRRVIYELNAKKLSGAVIGVPIVNLEGFKRATRYLPDRRDLNRYFPGRANGSYASRIAFSFFNKVVSHCDFLIDIHTGSLERTNLPQIRANLSDPKVAELAEKMGSIVVLQSTGKVGTLRRAATDASIPAVTFETGAPNNLQQGSVENGVKTINSALRSLGLTADSFWQRNKEPTYYRSRWIRAKQGGILFSKVALGDNVKEGTVLGLLSNPITNKTTEITATLEGRVIGMALNQIMYPGYAAYHIGLKSSAVEAIEPVAEGEDASDNASLENAKIDDELSNPDLEPIESTTSKTPDEPKATIEEMELPTVQSNE